MARVLVVEDEQFLRELMVRKLKHEGYDVQAAVDGEDGVRKAKENPPDIVLLDLILPGIDGFETLRQLKAEASTSAVPVIVLSNLGQKEDIEKGLKLGAIDYMIKAHFTPGEVIEKIQSILK